MSMPVGISRFFGGFGVGGVGGGGGGGLHLLLVRVEYVFHDSSNFQGAYHCFPVVRYVQRKVV